jgi:hypothetical protein
MAELTTTKHVKTENGHLSVHVDGMHAPELSFSFEHVDSRVGVGASVLAHLSLINN